jgi:hypothetical protein
MDLNEYYLRAKRTLSAVGCFLAAVFLVYRGNSFYSGSDFSLLVPVMCVFTALPLAATGLALILRETQPQVE